MLSLTPSLSLLPALRCPICGQILVGSTRDGENMFCPECGYSLSAKSPEQRGTNETTAH